MTGPELVALIEAHRFDCSTEESLQDGLEQLFDETGHFFAREARLNEHDRIDFLFPESTHEHDATVCVRGLGVEVKIKGSLSALTRQAHRYTKCERITGLVVVTAKVQLARLPHSLNGKPIHVAALLRGVF